MLGRVASARAGEARLLWQIAAIVLPVVVLATIAVYSLRRDRTAIEQDARRNAAARVEDLARRIAARASSALAAALAAACSGDEGPTDRGAQASCGLVLNGQVRVPFDDAVAPSPPGWSRGGGADPSGAQAIRLNAEWRALRAAVAGPGLPDAVERLSAFAALADGVLSEAGAPLPDLALLLALQQARPGVPHDALIDAVATRLAASPSFLSASLVDEASRVAPADPRVTRMKARWVADRQAVLRLRQLVFDQPGPSARWIAGAPGAWAAFVQPLAPPGPQAPTGARSAWHVALVPARAVESAFRAVPADQVPDYATVVVRLGERAWRADAPDAALPPPATLLAAATATLDLPLLLPADSVGLFAGELFRIAPGAFPWPQPSAGRTVRLASAAGGASGAYEVSVGLYLTDANALYASYRLRLWLAGGLIMVAALAALGGVAGAWRAFERQRRLGELKSNFVASVSHELRAPIAAMQLMSESLERGSVADPSRQREYFRLIGQECRRLAALVENVLDFSRMDQGRREYRFEPADVAAIVRRAVDVLRGAAERRQVKVAGPEPDAEQAAGWRRVDAEALQQVLMNLLDNAIKYSPDGTEIEVSIAGDEAEVRLSVADHGPGIPREEQARIFEPFYRGGSELRRETSGVGIGLAIAKQIVEAHGGRLEVESAPGSGSRFTIVLPAARETGP